MPITNHHNLYQPFAPVLSADKLEGSYKVARAALSDFENMLHLKQRPPANPDSPMNHVDWWVRLLRMAEENPLLSFSSDIFHLPTFKHHFRDVIKQTDDFVVMLIRPCEDKSISYKNLEMISNLAGLFMSRNGFTLFDDDRLELPPMVTYRTQYPNFTAYVVNKEFKVQSIGSYRYPTLAHNQRVVKQLEILTEIELDFSSASQLNLEQMGFLAAIPRLKEKLTEQVHRRFEIKEALIEKIMAEKPKEVKKVLSEEQQQKKMLRAAASSLANNFNQSIGVEHRKYLTFTQQVSNASIDHISRNLMKDQARRVREAILSKEAEEYLKTSVKKNPLNLKYRDGSQPPKPKLKRPRRTKEELANQANNPPRVGPPRKAPRYQPPKASETEAEVTS